jgi:hypothetical protein
MVIASAGGGIKLMFGGNGHSHAYHSGGQGNPGKVAVYWLGEKEKELVDTSALTADTLVQEGEFSDESFAFSADEGVWKSEQGLFDKGN